MKLTPHGSPEPRPLLTRRQVLPALLVGSSALLLAACPRRGPPDSTRQPPSGSRYRTY